MSLQTAIRSNAVLSVMTGSLLAIAPGAVGEWLGLNLDGWLRALGIALLGHAAVLWWAAGRRSLDWWARMNLAVIAPYPLLMLGLVVTGLVDTGLGRALVLIDGLLVGALAIAQWMGLPTRHGVAHPVAA